MTGRCLFDMCSEAIAHRARRITFGHLPMKTSMTRSLLFLPFLLLGISFSGFGQFVHRCGYDTWRAHQHTHNRAYSEGLSGVIENWKSAERGGGGGVLVLPVVFHIVYNTEAQNLSDEVILSQLEVLNEDYRRLNENAAETRDIFLPVAADCEIEFTLANTDPFGNPTSGITRIMTDRAGFALDLFSQTNTLDEVKKDATGGVDAWDTEHYINVWICNIESSFFGQVFGLAYPPATLDNWPAGSNAPDPTLEGVIVHYTTVGRNNPVAGDDGLEGNDGGRTLVHELGHYLGLRHTWGDALPFFEDGCTVDDGMSDTPNNVAADQFLCNFTSNTCEVDQENDLPDMIENYMDYSLDECMSVFTNEQKDLMRYVIVNLRPGLLDGVSITERVGAQFSVFPNPAKDLLTISLSQRITCEFELRDLTGRLISTTSVDGINVTMNCESLHSGVYLLTARDHKMSPQRIVIE